MKDVWKGKERSAAATELHALYCDALKAKRTNGVSELSIRRKALMKRLMADHAPRLVTQGQWDATVDAIEALYE